VNSENIEVVIPAFNGETMISDCISSVMEILPDSRITVVNDFSSDSTARIVSEDFPSVNLISNESNLGFGQSCNIGAFQSNCDWVLLLNQDAILRKINLENIGDITANDKVSVIGGKTEYRNGTLLHNIGFHPTLLRLLFFWPTLPLRFLGLNFGGLYETSPSLYINRSEVEWITGSCLFVRRDLFELQGGFDERFFIYVEEVEHAHRTKKEGFKIIFEPTIISMHENRSGIGMSPFSVYQTIRGQRIFISTNNGKIVSYVFMLSACLSCILSGLISSSLLWWSPKKRTSSWGLLKGGIRALFYGWGPEAGP